MRLEASVLRKASKVYVALPTMIKKRMEQLRLEIHKLLPEYKQKKSPQAQKKHRTVRKKTIMM